LPLQNLSGDPEQEYFADGMTDELIAVRGGCWRRHPKVKLQESGIA